MKKTIIYGIVPALALTVLGASVVSAQNSTENVSDMVPATRGMFMMGGGHGGGFMRGNLGTPEEFAQKQSTLFVEQAELTGIPVDEIKAAWAEGKRLETLLEEKGIDLAAIREKMQARVEEKMKERIQALVDKGVITQTQANERIEFMKNHQQKNREMKHPNGVKFEKRTKTSDQESGS